jgi:RNA polymerase sigma-70 factor (ECF subfamily)
MRFPTTRTEDAPDEQLMAAIQAGDSGALESLYNRYSRRLLIYFYRMLGAEEKAQDFLQDIFLKLTEHPHTFDTSRTFSKWIFSIAANMCKNEYRSLEVRRTHQNNGMESMVSPFDAESRIEERLDQEEFKIRLLHEVQNLDADQRNTFLLRFQENFSIKEIAQILNCSEGTVKSRLFYITRRLAIKLKNFDPFPHVNPRSADGMVDRKEPSTNNEVNYHGNQK